MCAALVSRVVVCIPSDRLHGHLRSPVTVAKYSNTCLNHSSPFLTVAKDSLSSLKARYIAPCSAYDLLYFIGFANYASHCNKSDKSCK